MSKKQKKSQEKEKIEPKLINSYLKKARVAMRDEDYVSAVKYYRLAAKCAAAAGDKQKEKIFNNRADEILEEHKIQLEVEEEKVFKKKRVKKGPEPLISKINISGAFITILIILLAFSGIFFELIFYPNNVSIPEMFFYWGVGIFVEIIAIILIILIYKYWILPPPQEEGEKKK